MPHSLNLSAALNLLLFSDVSHIDSPAEELDLKQLTSPPLSVEDYENDEDEENFMVHLDEDPPWAPQNYLDKGLCC